MSLVMMEGFEATFDQSDLTYQKGWMLSQSLTISGNTSVGVPSRTGIAGTGLMLKGPYSNSAAMPMATANAPDFGMNALNESVYAAWQSGGFCVGVNGTFNKVSQLEIAPYYSNQIVYDGVLNYWAIGLLNGTTPQVMYSTDLKTWTATQAQPPGLKAYSSLTVYGNGATTQVHVFNNNYGRNTGQVQEAPYGTSNNGVTWTQELGSVNWGTLQAYGAMTASTNASDPIGAMIVDGNTNCAMPTLVTGVGANGVVWGAGYYSSTSGVSSTNYYPVWSMAKTKQGMMFWTAFSPTPSALVPYAPTSQASTWLMTQSNWGNQWIAPNISAAQTDICYFAAGNMFVSVGYGGIYTIPSPGAAGTPTVPTGTWINPLNIGTGVIWAVDTNGTIVVAAGQDPVTGNGCIWTSTDGLNWSKQDRFLWSGVGGTTFTGVLWDGHQFILTGQLNAAVIATSPDGLNWSVVYYPDYAEQTVASTASLLGVYAGTPSNGAYVPWSAASNQFVGAGVLPAAVSGVGNNAARVVTPTLIQGNATPVAQSPTASVPLNSGLSHFYEFIFTAVPGSPNQFTAQWAIDSGIIGPLNGGNPIQLAGSSDVGVAQLFVNLPRNGQFTVIDDVYVTNMTTDAAGAQGQIGTINIINDPFSGDVSDQFSSSAATGSHASVVNTSFSNSSGYIYSATQGQQDVYSTNPTIPANYRVQAVMVEGYFAKYAGAGANGAVGVKSGSASATGSQGAGTGFQTGYSQLIQTTDPATNAAWTSAGLQAMKVTVTKTT